MVNKAVKYRKVHVKNSKYLKGKCSGHISKTNYNW